MDAPDTNVWGPCLWRILHMFVERTGKRGDDKNALEEKRCWTNLLNSLRTGIPCPLCRKHFIEYITKHKFESILALKGDARRDAMRKWFWDFHNTVRANKQQACDIELDRVAEMYAAYPADIFNYDKRVLIEQIRRGMFQRWLSREDMLRVSRAVDELWRVTPY